MHDEYVKNTWPVSIFIRTSMQQ